MLNYFATSQWSRRVSRCASLLVAVALLVGCGGDDDETPTATPSAPTATAAATTIATVITTGSPEVGSSTAVASPRANPTAGELADRIGAAWSNVTTYRTVTVTLPTDSGGTPTTISDIVTVAEVIVPSTKRWLNQTDGVTQYEFIAIDGRLFGRGPSVSATTDQGTNQSTWFEIDPTTVDSNSVFASLYEQLLSPVTAPYSSLSDEERAREAVPIGSRTIDGQPCAAYRLADTTQTGERIEIILAMSPDDLPCVIETRVGGLQTIATYSYNLPLTITAPIDATPAANG